MENYHIVAKSHAERRRIMMMRLPFTQEEVARLLGVSEAFLSRWLKDERTSRPFEQRFNQFYARHRTH